MLSKITFQIQVKYKLHWTKREKNYFCKKIFSVNYQNQTLYCPTDAHNVKNVHLLKQFEIKETAPTCFGLQGNHHQGATAST